MLCILHHLTASESDLMWSPECFVVINGLICLSVYFFFLHRAQQELCDFTHCNQQQRQWS